MPSVLIKDNIWKDLVKLAREQKRRPEVLTERALRDFIQREADEGLLTKSSKGARRARFRIEQTEDVIRRFRQQKKRRNDASPE